jgi:hypothetical protein
MKEAMQQKDLELANKNDLVEALNAEVADLKAKPAGEFTETAKEKDEHGGATSVVESGATKEANRLRRIRDGK